METWSTHHLFKSASETLDEKTTSALTQYAAQLKIAKLPVIFSLGHLAKITGVGYHMLRKTVERKRENANYRMYAIAKRSGGRRFIHSVSTDLLHVQSFLNQEVLQRQQPHPSSFAFHCSGGIRQCAKMHCGARWLFQYDLKDFFYNITEIDVYRIFKKLGYRSLLAFELARICTTTHLPCKLTHLLYNNGSRLEEALPYFPRVGSRIGVLPQGAPSSPMLSNLAARELDKSLQEYATKVGFIYTRYADDITFSSCLKIPAHMRGSIHRSILNCIRKSGFKENRSKIHIAGPGSRKIVLGLLVDGDSPRISKDFYKRIDRYLYATQKYGLAATAKHWKFDSAFGFYNHLSGLIAFVKDVDVPRWEKFSKQLNSITILYR